MGIGFGTHTLTQSCSIPETENRIKKTWFLEGNVPTDVALDELQVKAVLCLAFNVANVVTVETVQLLRVVPRSENNLDRHDFCRFQLEPVKRRIQKHPIAHTAICVTLELRVGITGTMAYGGIYTVRAQG